MVRRPLSVEQIEVVDNAIADILRGKTPGQRLEMMFSAHRTMRAMLEASITREHPHWPRKRVLRHVAGRMLGGAG